MPSRRQEVFYFFEKKEKPCESKLQNIAQETQKKRNLAHLTSLSYKNIKKY